MINAIKSKTIKFWVIVTASSLLFLTIATYSLFKMRYIISGVTINASIENNTPSGNLIKIKGDAKHAKFLSLNGREITIDKDGAFEEKIALPTGFSVITLAAEDKFGKSIEKTIEVYKKENNVVAFNTIINH